MVVVFVGGNSFLIKAQFQAGFAIKLLFIAENVSPCQESDEVTWLLLLTGY